MKALFAVRGSPPPVFGFNYTSSGRLSRLGIYPERDKRRACRLE